MGDEWGSVEGDTNAQVIISDRRGGKKLGLWVGAAIGVGLLIAAIAYGTTGSPGALATTIVLATYLITTNVHDAVFSMHTIIIIAETRARILEATTQRLEAEVASLRREARGRSFNDR